MIAVEPPLININLPLEQLLKKASPHELAALVDILTDNGKGRLSLSQKAKNHLIQHKKAQTLPTIIQDIQREICAFGGNSIKSLVSDSPDYSEVVRDVATKLGIKVQKTAGLAQMEKLIIIKSVEKIISDKQGREQLKKLCSEERIQLDDNLLDKLQHDKNTAAQAEYFLSALGSYQLSTLLASSLMMVLGSASTSLLTITASRMLMLNPIAAVLSSAWMTYQLSGPAYRVTVPFVILVSAIRQSWMKSMTNYYCQEMKKCL